MDPQPTPLAHQIANLKIAAQASPASGFLCESIHALITACLLRLFTRLDLLFQLWQSGTLPRPAYRHPAEKMPQMHLAQARRNYYDNKTIIEPPPAAPPQPAPPPPDRSPPPQ